MLTEVLTMAPGNVAVMSPPVAPIKCRTQHFRVLSTSTGPRLPTEQITQRLHSWASVLSLMLLSVYWGIILLNIKARVKEGKKQKYQSQLNLDSFCLPQPELGNCIKVCPDQVQVQCHGRGYWPVINLSQSHSGFSYIGQHCHIADHSDWLNSAIFHHDVSSSL